MLTDSWISFLIFLHLHTQYATKKYGNEALSFQFRVTDACVINGAQLLPKHRLDIGDILKGDGAIVEMPLLHLTIDDAVDEVANAFFGILGQTA